MFEKFENRDYTLIIDKSFSMADPANSGVDGAKSRWEVMRESTQALARECQQYDPDGIIVYTFSGKFKLYENVTVNTVKQIFQENRPGGSTDLAGVLQHALNNYFQRKANNKLKENGEIILVVTDGEPDDKRSVVKIIVDATKKLDKPEELRICFIQVGDDSDATKFLKSLDDDLKGKAEAKFDIVATVTVEDINQEDISIEEVLLRAIQG